MAIQTKLLIFALSPFYILIYNMFYEMIHGKVRGLSCKPNIYVSWSTSEPRLRLWLWNLFKPSSIIFYRLFHGDNSFVDHLCYFCLVLVMLSRLLFAALWSLLGKDWPLGSRLWFLIVFLSLSHVVSRVRCGTWLYRFLIFAPFLTFSSHLSQF